MPIPGLDSSVSAIKAFGTKMAATANNIANSQSLGHKKTRVLMKENDQNQGVAVNITRIDTPGALSYSGEELSNVDIAEEISSMIPTQRGFEANVKTVRTADEMAGTLINIVE